MEVDNITKEVHPHYMGNTIDLLFDEVNPSCNPSIFVVSSGVKEQLVEIVRDTWIQRNLFLETKE